MCVLRLKGNNDDEWPEPDAMLQRVIVPSQVFLPCVICLEATLVDQRDENTSALSVDTWYLAHSSTPTGHAVAGRTGTSVRPA